MQSRSPQNLLNNVQCKGGGVPLESNRYAVTMSLDSGDIRPVIDDNLGRSIGYYLIIDVEKMQHGRLALL